MKGRLQGLFFLLIIFIALQPSLCFAGDFNYNDSYVQNEDTVDNSLFFVPLPPDSPYKDYMIFSESGSNNIYFYSSDPWLGCYDIISFGSGSVYRIVNWNPGILYVYNLKNNTWNFVCEFPNGSYDYGFQPIKVLDSTVGTIYHYGQDIYEFQSQPQKTGYKIYWTMSLILLQILDYVNYAADLVLSNDILKYALFTLFGGEILFFVITLINKIGDIKNEKLEE